MVTTLRHVSSQRPKAKGKRPEAKGQRSCMSESNKTTQDLPPMEPPAWRESRRRSTPTGMAASRMHSTVHGTVASTLHSMSDREHIWQSCRIMHRCQSTISASISAVLVSAHCCTCLSDASHCPTDATGTFGLTMTQFRFCYPV
jgi:hypothetical protein